MRGKSTDQLKLKAMYLSEEEIREIIEEEIEVDCYHEEEVNMSWATYLGDTIFYPFEAEYLVKKKSGETSWKKVIAVNNETDESSFMGKDYYVEIEINDMIIPVKLKSLRNVEADAETLQALQVWENKNSH